MKRWILSTLIFALGMPWQLALAQRLSDSAPDPLDAFRSVWVGLHSWTGWTLDTGIDATLQLSASADQWREAAVVSPTAAFYMAAFTTRRQWHAVPVSVVEGFSYSCGGRMATPAAVLQRLADEDMQPDDTTMPPLRPGELYHVQLRTSYLESLPREMQFTTRWYRFPHPVRQIGQLRVVLESRPMHWLPVYLSRAEAPVMRVAEVHGWQDPPPW